MSLAAILVFWRAALASAETALRLDPNDADLVRRKIIYFANFKPAGKN